jgi:hypothetical protein
VWEINEGEPSWTSFVELAPALQAKLETAANANGMALYAQMKEGDTKFLRLVINGPIIESTIRYNFTIDMAVQLAGVDPFKDTDGIYGIGYTFTGVHDATMSKAISVSIVNKLTAL